MQKFKPGLKKGIAAIFEGVRIPKELRVRQAPGAQSASPAVIIEPKPITPKIQTPHPHAPPPRGWPAPGAPARKRSKFSSFVSAFKKIPLRIFRPRSMWADKRKTAMARHLLS